MLNYRIEGSGPPLLLVHGFGISFEIWTALAPYLRDHFTLITIELPGIGLSPAPPRTATYLAAAVDALEATRTALGIPHWKALAYSTGARVVEIYAQIYPQMVEQVAFICPLKFSRANKFGLRLAGYFDQSFPQLGDWILSGPRLRFLVRLLAFNMQTQPLAEEWFKFISLQPIPILKEMLLVGFATGNGGFHLPQNIPSLLLWAGQDWIISPPSKPNVNERIFRGNHSAPQTSAEEIFGLVSSFLMGE